MSTTGRRARRGLALIDLIVATSVALSVLAVVSIAMSPLLDLVRAFPETVDIEQRSRATAASLTAIVGLAGAGADLLGEGPLTHAVPAIWPRRVLGGADPPGTAWGDRLSLMSVPDRAPQAPLAAPVPPGGAVVTIQWHPACGTHLSCGFRPGDVVVMYSRTGAMAVSTVAATMALQLTLETTTDQAIELPATIAVVRVTTLAFDTARRQLRRTEDAASSQPLTDDVVGMTVRYYGNAAPPRWPARPGQDTCAVAADGTPRLGLLGPVPGPPVELALADLIDGPWCGAGQWRFDADLLRVTAVRIALRLQAMSTQVRGAAVEWFAIPGRATHPRQEVRDEQLDVFALAPNLAWTQ